MMGAPSKGGLITHDRSIDNLPSHQSSHDGSRDVPTLGEDVECFRPFMYRSRGKLSGLIVKQ